MFFKTIGKMKSDNRGFTLAELMVTVVIMALVAGIIALIAGNIWRRYRLVENRFIIQTEVKAIMDAYSLDASQGSLSTATNVDLLYEDPAALTANRTFASCPELGEFTEDETTHKLHFNSRDTTNASFNAECFQYTYLFVYDDHLYVLNGKTADAYRFCYTDEIKVNIKYEVSVDAFGKDDTGKEGDHRKDSESGEINYNHTYLIDGVTITVENADGYDFKYALHTSFALKNTLDGNQVNLNNPASKDYFSSPYCAGFTYGDSLKDNKDSTITSHKASDVTYSHLTDEATVIKYISLKNFASGDVSGNSGSTTTNMGGCTFSFLMMNSGVGEGVLNTLRDFRDNTLRGTAIGDKIIEKYYAWSPAVVSVLSEHDALRGIAAEMVEDTAYIMELSK